MGEAEARSLPVLLVLTSTYPRWSDDPEPGFVHQLASRLTDRFRVVVLAPHAPAALGRETMDAVSVVRFRYAFSGFETLVNDGGIVQNLRRHRWKWLLTPGFMVSQFFYALYLIRKLKPAVVHAHWFVPQGLVAALSKWALPSAPPFVLTSHGADLFALKGAFWDRLRRWVVSRADQVTVVSEVMRDALAAGGSASSRIHVEPMGVDLERRFTADHRVSRDTEKLLFVGRLVPKKGLHVLIEALPKVLAARPSVTLEVVGFGPELETLRQLAKRVGVSLAVRFVGAVDQDGLPRHYREAAVFVAPFIEAPGGDQEGLGLVLLEALGCGCKVVVSDLAGTRALTEAPGSLWRVPPGQPAELADQILAALDAEAGPSHPALRRFDWSHRATAYARILHEASGALPRGTAA